MLQHDALSSCALTCAHLKDQSKKLTFEIKTGKAEVAELTATIDQESEGGMIRSETLIELKLFNSSFSSLFIILLKLDQQFSIEQFEPTVSQSAVSSPPSRGDRLHQLPGGGGLGRHYLSNATCLTRPRLFYVCFRRVKEHHNLLHRSPLLKKACVRKVVLDKWFPLKVEKLAGEVAVDEADLKATRTIQNINSLNLV